MRRFFQKWKGSFKNRNTIRGSFENEQVLSKAIVFPSTVGGSFENNRVLSKMEGFFRNRGTTGGSFENNIVLSKMEGFLRNRVLQGVPSK